MVERVKEVNAERRRKAGGNLFEKSYDARQILEHNLSDKATADKTAIDEKVASGISRKEAAAEYLTDQAFDQWYEEFCKALSASVE